jgi:hypothetical protein
MVQLMNRLLVTPIALVALVTASCTGGIGVQPDTAVVPPELEDPTFEVVAIAADDLGRLDATVTVNGQAVQSSVDDPPTLTWEKSPIEIEAAAVGFHPFVFTVEEFPDAARIEVRLEPVVLQGRVTTENGRPLPGVKVTLGSSADQTDLDGGYSLERAEAGTIRLSRPAWMPAEYAWDGSFDRYDLSMSSRVVKAIRVSPEDLLDAGQWQSMLGLTEITGINGLVVDLKTEDGTVVYRTDVATANSIGAVSSYFELADVVNDASERDLYLIGRIGVFQDDFLAADQPDNAVLNEDGSLWRSRNGIAWLDPSDPASFEYSIALAEEACLGGFDEIQFDYVSYPLGGGVSTAVFDGENNQEVRVASINAFLTRAYSVLHPIGCAVSSTVLGIVLESSQDEGIGQLPGSMSRIVDVLSPTLYSTNYPSGWGNFEDPNEHAVEIVDTALRGGTGKLDGFAYLRPWLQTWTISKVDQRAVQRSVGDDGMGWMLWSNVANYTRDALPRP